MTPQIAYVGIGSNLGDSAGFVREGFAALERVGRVVAVSDLYLTKPWGGVEQPSFINAAAAIETGMRAHDLVAELLRLEQMLGRTRGERFGPRTIDFDLLVYGAQQVSEPGCIVPHPQLTQRAFALAPLAQIAPDLDVPGTGATATQLLAALPAEERLGVRQFPGTARLAPAALLDYDAPAGAGTGYAELRPFSSFDRDVLAAALAALGPIEGLRILDVGCGTGRFTRELAACGADVTGFDASATMLAAAKTHAPPDRARAPVYVRGDANAELPPGPFDAITSFYALQYLDVGAFFRRATRALVPSGRIAVVTFPHRHFVESEFSKFFPSMAAIDLARFPSRQRVGAALHDAGFEDVQVCEIVAELRDPPSPLIEKVERKYLSSFHLLSDAEFREGVSAMRRAWADLKDVPRNARAIVVSGVNRRTSDSGRNRSA